MNATHKIKLVSMTTALGVFLVGCGGGPNNEVSRTVTGSSSTGSTIPYASPVTSAGNGTVGYGSTETLDQIAADTRATNNAIAGINSKLDQTVSSSKKASNWGMVAGIAGAALVGFGALKMVGGMKAYNEAHKAATGQEAGFFKRLTQGGLFGNRGESFRAQVNTDQHAKTLGKVEAVNTNVDGARADTTAWGGTTAEIAAGAYEAASAANASSQKAVEKVAAVQKGQEIAETRQVGRHTETLDKLSKLEINMNELTATVIKFNDDMKAASQEVLKANESRFEELKKELSKANIILNDQIKALGSDISIELKAMVENSDKKFEELKKQSLIENKEKALEAAVDAANASKLAFDEAAKELSKVKIVPVTAAGSQLTHSPASSGSPTNPPPAEVKNLVNP